MPAAGHMDDCLSCHLAGSLHAKEGHSNCSQCHDGTPKEGTVTADKCAVCHPTGNPGKCNLVDYHGRSCLTCHIQCSDDISTTTTTTTTPPLTDCITIEPTSVTVFGTDKPLPIIVTFTRTDVKELTPEELEKLVIEIDDACAQYITINSYTLINNAEEVTADLNITVQGDAPSSLCTIKVSDPDEVATPPLNCATTFTITQSPPGACGVASVEPTILPLKAGLLPKVRRIVITGEGSSNWDRNSEVLIEDIETVIPLRTPKPDKIIALMVIPSTLSGFKPDLKKIIVRTIVNSNDEICSGYLEIK